MGEAEYFFIKCLWWKQVEGCDACEHWKHSLDISREIDAEQRGWYDELQGVY